MTESIDRSGRRAGAPPAKAGGAQPRSRMGGIALNNGLILVSEHNWAAAIRGQDGGIVTASGRKPQVPVGGGGVSGQGGVPLLRGLGRFAESLLVLAQVKGRLPQAELPIEGTRVVAALAAAFGATTALKVAAPKSPLIQEAGGALAAFIPAVLAVRNSSISGYHGAEHKVIGGLEAALGAEGGRIDDDRLQSAQAADPRRAAGVRSATKEHDRCGSNLIGPFLLATVATNLLARGRSGKKSPVSSALAGAASLGIALEALRWATNHGDSVLARLLLLPGRTVQRRLTTAEPSPAQLEVGQRALDELLLLERSGT